MERIFYIKGMHCAGCEIILEKDLNAIKGVKVVKISHKTNKAVLEVKDFVNEQNIKNVVKKNNFTLSINKKDSKDSKKTKRNSIVDYIEIIAITVILGDILLIFRNVDVTRIFPNIGGQAGVLVALIFGLIASLSTCLIMVGGIVISFGSIYPTEKNKDHPVLQRVQPHIYFHLGRILGFGVLGGILGLIGQKISYSVIFTGYLTMIVSVVMVYMALYILNIVPGITKWGFYLPKSLSKNIHSLQENDHCLIPIVIGVLTFFLPCGFTQSMQLAAVVSGSFVYGFLIMSAFALGTLPVLLSVGMGASFAKDSRFGTLKRIAGVLIIFFALYSLNSGLVLSGNNSLFTFISSSPLKDDYFTTKQDPSLKIFDKKVLQAEAEYQVINMDVDWTFKPRHFVMKKRIPVRWEIQGINITGCSNEVVIPRLNISKKISKGLNVVNFTPTMSGDLPFSCWMGMINGNFKVVDTDEELQAWRSKGFNNVNVSNFVYDEDPAQVQDVQVPANLNSKTNVKANDNIDLVNENIYVPPEGVLPSGSCGGACGGASCGAKTGGVCGCSSRRRI